MIVNIEFTKPKNPNILSRIISLIEGTEYSHVRLRFNDYVYEASGISVHFQGKIAQTYCPAELLHTYSVELDIEQYSKLLKLCMDNAGIEYGFKQLIGIGLVRLFGLKNNPFSDGRKSQVCSEIIGRFLQEILNIGKDLDLDIASPKDIKNVLDKTYGEK